jgi:hypothetical protein
MYTIIKKITAMVAHRSAVSVTRYLHYSPKEADAFGTVCKGFLGCCFVRSQAIEQATVSEIG